MWDREDVSDFAWKWRYKLTHVGREDQKFDASQPLDESSSSSLDKAGTTGQKEKGSSKPTSSLPPAPALGADVAIKTYYQGKGSNEQFHDWVDYPPKQLSKRAAKAEDRIAIKVYKIKDMDKPVISGRFALKYFKLEIQNPALVEALKPIVSTENVHLDPTEVASFQYPFRPLYFNHERIYALWTSLPASSPVKSYLGLLVGLLNDVFGDSRLRIKRLRESNLISFKLAWAYFPKGQILFSVGMNCEALSRVENAYYKTTGSGTVLVIETKVIMFDGENFVWSTQDLTIGSFHGNKPITDLRHYPLEFHPDAEGVKGRMMERGTKVLDLQGLTYCNYNGVGIFMGDKSGEPPQRHNVDGRILVDVAGYQKHHCAKGVREGKDLLSQKKLVITKAKRTHGPDFVMVLPEAVDSGIEHIIDDGWDESMPVMAPPPVLEDKNNKSKTSIKRLTEQEMRDNKEHMRNLGEELMFMSPQIQGYALKNKTWLEFFVDDLADMTWNDEAYEHLVYDEQQKDLVLSFVQRHRRTNLDVEDVIMGKGQGLIILLSGPPGAGKTLMAEAVADRTRRPLFYLQAEDLGINAAILGARIKIVFEMAAEWDAVILLDEADVFMAERFPNDIARNELVSIFLRELEYFRGIIFLTTNLYDTIDAAFRSRVNLHLLFNPLGPDARLTLWRKFLERVPVPRNHQSLSKGKAKLALHDSTPLVETTTSSTSTAVTAMTKRSYDISEDDLKQLAMWQLNGREIKNAVKMVSAWCVGKGYVMDLARMESGIRATNPHAVRKVEGVAADDELYE